MAPLLLIGAAVGGAAMYILDPDRGRRRRALLRDQVIKTRRKVADVIDAGTRDLANRGAAVPHQVASMFHWQGVPDDVLAERVRAKMGRYVAHPGAVEVTAAGGHVTLCGSILAHEHKELLMAVQHVAGVRDIVDRLTVYKTADHIPELQGGRRRRGERIEIFQDNWAPGTRMVTGAAASFLALYGLRTGGVSGVLALAAGAALFARTAANKPMRQIAGMGGHRGIDVRKTIQVNAPADRVFEYLANYENFPHFMRHVRSVHVRDDERSHWTVDGPAGTTVEWDSVTTRFEPNQHLAWRTVPGSIVQHAGMITLERCEDDATRVHLLMSYNPPAGALGHAIARMLGRDPKTELDDDLMRLKSTLETGRPPRDAAQPNTSARAQALP